VSERTRDDGEPGSGNGLASWFRTELRDTTASNACYGVRDSAAREEIPAI
jgi:hypothetical protein